MTADLDREVRQSAIVAVRSIDKNWTEHPNCLDQIPFLAEKLSSTLGQVREGAADTLVKLGVPSVLPVLRAIPKAANADDQSRCADVVRRIFKSADVHSIDAGSQMVEFVTTWQIELPNYVRAYLLEALSFHPDNVDDDSLEKLMRLQDDENALFRESRIRQMLCKFLFHRTPSTPEISRLLVKLIGDRDEDVNRQAQQAIVKHGECAADAIIEAIENWEADVAKYLLEKLAERFGMDIPEDFAEWRKAGVNVWANLNWSQILIEDELEFRREILARYIHCLGEIGPDAQKARKHLLNIVEGKSWPVHVKSSAIRSIGKIGFAAKDCADAIIPKLFSTKDAIREPAGWALDQISETWRDHDKLKQTLQTKIPKLLAGLEKQRDASEFACQAIGKNAVPTLIEALESDQRVASERAARILGKMGSDANDAIPNLNRVAKSHNNRFVRNACIHALEQIKKIDPE